MTVDSYSLFHYVITEPLERMTVDSYSLFHYVITEPLERMTVDNDMMIRGLTGKGMCASWATPSSVR